MSDEELSLLYQDHQGLKVSELTILALEISKRDLTRQLLVSSEEPEDGHRVKPTIPRIHHYFFVPRLLRDKVFHDPPSFFEKFHNGSMQNYLFSFWLTSWLLNVGKQGQPFVEPDGLCVHPLEQIGDLHMGLVAFPPPMYWTEAYFAAIVFNQDATLRRYFTLEFSETRGGTPRLPVFCEWNGETHNNFGELPSPSREEFAAYVRKATSDKG
jgi:hypothetical protein